MSTPEDELGGQPADFDQMAKNSTPNEDLEDQPATFSQIAEKSTPWDDDVIELTDDYDFEDDVAEDVDNLISSLCRQEEL
ncbi:hypothetical protein OFP26_35700, partial [Escherichia coli]|nr:hypothetical protein [Escherichia coli]